MFAFIEKMKFRNIEKKAAQRIAEMAFPGCKEKQKRYVRIELEKYDARLKAPKKTVVIRCWTDYVN